MERQSRATIWQPIEKIRFSTERSAQAESVHSPERPKEEIFSGSKAWCHCAPGKALSRLGALPILDTPQIRENISGLRATRLAGTRGLDTLCGGTMGRIETFVVAAKELGDPAYLQEARETATPHISNECRACQAPVVQLPFTRWFTRWLIDTRSCRT
jgi:lantibiotic modifying enzyme